MNQRPTSVLVFAIIDIVLGALFSCVCLPLGVLSMLGLIPGGENDPTMKLMESNAAYAWFTYINTALSTITSIMLLCAGIGMLQLKPWARVMAIIWSLYTIVSMIMTIALNTVLMYIPWMNSSNEQEQVMAYFGLVFGIGFLVVFVGYALGQVYVLTRPSVVRAFSDMPPLTPDGPMDAGGSDA